MFNKKVSKQITNQSPNPQNKLNLNTNAYFHEHFLKFIYSEKATQFSEISTLLLTGTTQDKSKVEISLNVVAFLEYIYELQKIIKIELDMKYSPKFYRLLLQTTVIAFVVIYQLWYARGYQEFAEVEASVTTKVKGFSM